MIPSGSATNNSSNKFRNKRKRDESRGAYKYGKKLKSNAPSAKEIQELREFEDLFQSNFFRLQMDELFKELKPEIDNDKLDQWISDFEEHISKIPKTAQSPIDEYSVKVTVPIVKTVKSSKGVFRFSPPTRIIKIGSLCLNTVCSSNPVLDIAVEIPKDCWQTSDFLNERYHRKRALYLACIAESLQGTALVKDLKFVYKDGCYLKPNLMIIPNGVKNVAICLTAYPCKEAFRTSRFRPSMNNVRPSWYLKAEKDDLQLSTPYYNATVLMDILLVDLHNFLIENVTKENIAKGIILLKLWCLQRELSSGYGRMNGFILTMIVAYLFKKQKVNSTMSPYQVFRSVLVFFRNHNFEEHISLADDDKYLDDHKKLYPSVFLDPSGVLNIIFFVNKESLIMLKHESNLALKILDSEMPGSFSFLFMNKISTIQKFDYLLHLRNPKRFKKWSRKLNNEQDSLAFLGDKIAAVVPKLCAILQRGLTNRIILLDIIRKTHEPWPVNECPPDPNTTPVVICFLLNPEVPLLNIEKGPNADDPEARVFRQFWGDRSELRRFQDGSIREAVFWPASTLEDKRKVFMQIVKDILIRHLAVNELSLTMAGCEFDCLLNLPPNFLSSEFEAYGTGEEAHMTVVQSFNSLSQLLHNLSGLPLMISSVQGISPTLHFSEVFPPLPISHSFNSVLHTQSEHTLRPNKNAPRSPTFTPAVRAIVSFEASGKWPDDLEALRRLKTAFLIKISEVLQKQHSLIAVPFLDHADIFKDGFVFRLELACHKELYLMKQVKLPDGGTKMRETEETRNLEITTETLPKLNSLLLGIHQQHNSYGPACRLAKRWVSSQLKYDYVQETVIELIVAYCYVHPEPFIIPCSPQVAFIRFLYVLANFEWNVNPLFVNFNLELKKTEMEEIQSNFMSQRSTLPAMVIVTPLDKRGTMFTRKNPHPLILKRIVMLAKASFETVNKILYNCQEMDLKVMFRPAFDSFDTIIFLNRHMLSKLAWAVDQNVNDDLPCVTPSKTFKVFPVVDYDPALKYFEELQSNFQEFAFFFCDAYGGDFIAVVWKKSEFAPRDFSVYHANSRIVTGKSVAGNIESILEDFRLLGNGLVKYIKHMKNIYEKLCM